MRFANSANGYRLSNGTAQKDKNTDRRGNGNDGAVKILGHSYPINLIKKTTKILLEGQKGTKTCQIKTTTY